MGILWNHQFRKLDPFLDQDGILKVWGRIGKLDISDEIQYPTLFPKSCKTTELTVRWCHTCWSRYHHQPNKIFWFLDHKLQFIGAINDWEMYQMRWKLQQQKMTDLPKDRMCTEPPVTYGVDISEPFVAKKKAERKLRNMVRLFTQQAQICSSWV